MKSREKIKEETLNELYTKKTSPKTLKIQKAKTAKSEAFLFWDSANGAYVKSENANQKSD